MKKPAAACFFMGATPAPSDPVIELAAVTGQKKVVVEEGAAFHAPDCGVYAVAP
jgi:hypothetical protein